MSRDRDAAHRADRVADVEDVENDEPRRATQILDEIAPLGLIATHLSLEQ
ncbi:hypothetical protein [Methylocystis sp.]